jgi:hypothetical protein
MQLQRFQVVSQAAAELCEAQNLASDERTKARGLEQG